MAMVINTNMASANAVRLLDSSSKEQSTSMERLTSGLRINSAADDAAGLAIATKMSSQINGTETAIRNANDGVSMIQTIDGASEEVVSMMQRMRELGVQSMNETYSTENRTQMDAEYQQLVTEIDRVAETTKFNGINVMNADASLNIQAGWETTGNDQIAIDTKNMNTTALGSDAAFTSITSGDLTMQGIDGAGDSISFTVGGTTLPLADRVTVQIDWAANTMETEAQFNEQLANAISADQGLQALGVTATYDSQTEKTTIAHATANLVAGDLAITAEVAGGGGSDSTNASMTAATVNDIVRVSDTDITSAANAKIAIDTIDAALTDVSNFRSESGAKQNRLDHTISNLSSVNESITGARSRILDADFATESANLARSQVLQQAGMSMLSQANANSQNVLSLLR